MATYPIGLLNFHLQQNSLCKDFDNLTSVCSVRRDLKPQKSEIVMIHDAL